MIFKRKTWIRRHKTEIKALGEVIVPAMTKGSSYLITTLRKSILYTLDADYKKQVDLERKKILDKCKQEFSRE
jgi:hypothetical protein